MIYEFIVDLMFRIVNRDETPNERRLHFIP